MSSWSLVNACWDAFSELRFRETVISTIEPEEMFAGRRIEGNSI